MATNTRIYFSISDIQRLMGFEPKTPWSESQRRFNWVKELNEIVQQLTKSYSLRLSSRLAFVFRLCWALYNPSNCRLPLVEKFKVPYYDLAKRRPTSTNISRHPFCTLAGVGAGVVAKISANFRIKILVSTGVPQTTVRNSLFGFVSM